MTLLALCALLMPNASANYPYNPPSYMECVGGYDPDAVANVCINPDPGAGRFNEFCMEVCVPIPNTAIFSWPWSVDWVHADAGCNFGPTFGCLCEHLPIDAFMVKDDGVEVCFFFLPDPPA